MNDQLESRIKHRVLLVCANARKLPGLRSLATELCSAIEQEFAADNSSLPPSAEQFDAIHQAIPTGWPTKAKAGKLAGCLEKKG